MANGMFAGQSALPSYLQPTQGKTLYGGNYLNFIGGGDSQVDQWAQQFLPDVYDKEIEIYGNRTISGFLKMVSADVPSAWIITVCPIRKLQASPPPPVSVWLVGPT